jgi:hypothetical protein
VSSSTLSLVRAHIFSPNESASFLSIVDQIKSTLLPIKEDVSSNDTVAKMQAQYARTLLTDNMTKELRERNQRVATVLVQMLDSLQNVSKQNVNAKLSNINNILAEAITVRIDKDKLKNATVQALALANDVNQILNEYTTSMNESNASINMNMNMNMNMSSRSSMNMDHQNGSMKMDMTNNTNASNKEKVMNLASYQRANTLTDIAIERFNTELKGKSNAASAMEQVIKGLNQLKMSIQKNASTTTVMGIVHGQIHPNLQTAFSLQLAPAKENNGNMSMPMPTSNPNDQSKHNDTMNMG